CRRSRAARNAPEPLALHDRRTPRGNLPTGASEVGGAGEWLKRRPDSRLHRLLDTSRVRKAHLGLRRADVHIDVGPGYVQEEEEGWSDARRDGRQVAAVDGPHNLPVGEDAAVDEEIGLPPARRCCVRLLNEAA